MVGEEGAERRLAAERDQQQVAGHHRRQDQRQVDQRVDQALAQKSLRASSQAMATPTGRLTAVAVVATSRLNRIAVHSSGVMPRQTCRRDAAPSR